MIKIEPPFKSRFLTILIFSLIYAVVFYFTFTATQNAVVVNFTLLPILLVAWWWGIIPAIIMQCANLFWTSQVIRFTGEETNGLLGLEPVLVNLIHLALGFVTGTFSLLVRRMQTENVERKKAEIRLEEYKSRLEEMVLRRTEELEKANAKLHQIEKMEAIGQLAGGIAHDFNNHLTIILGYCEFLLGKKSLDKEIGRVIQQIRTSGKRSADLTKQLLAFSRRGMYDLQVVDMNMVVRETIQLLNRSIHKNISLISRIDAPRPHVWGGASHLQNAVLNLALNARDAMPEGGVLTIETSNRFVDESFGDSQGFSFKTGEYLIVTVKDTGTGIKPEVMQHIFEPFFTTKKDQQGTGMGLAAVYGIAKSHGGAITADSTVGEGTTFNLYIPVTQRHAIKGEKERFPIEFVSDDHLLVIDDDKQVSETIRDMLQGLGYRVTVAYSGEEAVSVYQKNYQNIKAVFIDMLMPGMDGSQTFLKLKEINPEIIAVIVSGYTLTENVQYAIEKGAKGFLQKPFSYEQMRQVLVKILDKGEVKN